MDLPKKETLTIEFKSDKIRLSDSQLIDEIVGMANTEGGILYLGIEDDGSITGVHKEHKDAVGLAALIANNTVPPISVRAELLLINDLSVMTIEIPKSRAVTASKAGKIMRRQLKANGEPENVPMYPYEITSRLSDLSLLDFSAQALAEATPDDLDPNQMVRLRQAIQNNRESDKYLLELSDEDIQKALHFLKEENGKIFPTVTGMLMVGKEERIKYLMPTVGADFQVLQGTNVLINQSYRKPIVETSQLFEEYLKPWNPEEELEYGIFRMEVPAFSTRAFREGLMNAFAHRDYSRMGRIRVEIAEEGMTISSPGGFIEGVTVDNLIHAEPHGRNQTLADAMKRVGLAEKTGRGIDRIYEGSIVYGRPWPDYSDSNSTRVILFIPRAKADMSFAKMIADEQNRRGIPLTINYLLILSKLKEERRMDVDRLLETTHINRNRLLIILENLHEEGLIETFGSGRSKTYTLSRSLYKQAGKGKEYVRQTGIDKIRYSEMILKLAKEQDGYITKNDVVELLHIGKQQAYKYIAELVQEKKLEKITSGRYAKYKIV